MKTMIEGDYYTCAEAAKLLGVTVARVHILCRTYGVNTVKPHPMFKLIPKDELKKIPPKRVRSKLSGKRMDLR